MAISISFCSATKGQTAYPSNIDTSFFGWTPPKTHKVLNGIAIGWTAHPWSTWNDTVFIKVNGLNLEVGSMGIIGGLWGTMYGLVGVKDNNNKRASFFSNYGYDSLIKDYPKYGTHINGISVSLGGVSETYNHGIFINGLSGYSYEIEGVQISGLINNTVELKGVSISALANISTKAKGIQIGLINKCKIGNILQIGLFNRIGKRVTPFVNFRFIKEHKTI